MVSPLLAFAHLAVLSAFALAQPLFNLLSDNPEFFAARGSTASEIIVFALLLVLVPPAVLLAIELLVGLASEQARDVLHLVFVGGLAAVVFVQALKKAIDAGDTVLIVLALALGAAAALLYHRAEPVRSFLSVLSPGAAAVPRPVPVLLGRVEDRAARGRQREVRRRAWRRCRWW